MSSFDRKQRKTRQDPSHAALALRPFNVHLDEVRPAETAEIRIPKSEIRNKSKARIGKYQNPAHRGFEFLPPSNFEFVSDFEIRISIFKFRPSRGNSDRMNRIYRIMSIGNEPITVRPIPSVSPAPSPDFCLLTSSFFLPTAILLILSSPVALKRT